MITKAQSQIMIQERKWFNNKPLLWNLERNVTGSISKNFSTNTSSGDTALTLWSLFTLVIASWALKGQERG